MLSDKFQEQKKKWYENLIYMWKQRVSSQKQKAEKWLQEKQVWRMILIILLLTY